jgi:integrase
MASITKYRGSTWRAIVRKVGFKAESKTFDTKAEATRWATGVESAMDSGKHRDIPREGRGVTVAHIFQRYLKEEAPKRKGARNAGTNIRYLLRTAAFMDRRLDQINAADIRDYRDKRLTEVSPASVNRIMNDISGIFRHAIKEWGAPLQANPVHLVSRPKNHNVSRTRRWTEDEIQRVLKAVNWKEDEKLASRPGPAVVGWAVLLGIETAMRRGELCQLRPKDINAEEKYAQLYDTKNGDSRRVPLSVKALKWLTFLSEGKEQDALLFGIKPGSLSYAWRRARREAGLQNANIHFHDTRHEAATRMSKKLVNVLELSAVTGHRSLQSLKRYYNPTPGDLASKLG